MGVAIPQVVSATEDRASGAQVIDGGLIFDSNKSEYLSRTPGSAGNRRTATWSGWVKLGNHSSTGEYYLLCTNGTTDSTFFYIQIRNNQLRFGQYNSGTFALYSTQLFRDPSAWYHIVVAVDTTQATASNRAKAYVNGTEITSWSTANYPAQNNDLGINDTRAHAIGSGYSSGSPYAYWDGYVTAINFIDGQALDASYFGYTDPLTNVWRPKKFKPQATPNNGTVWSSTSTIPTNPANAFDGDISTYATISAINGTRTVTTGSFTIKSTLEVYIQANAGYIYTFTINGTAYTLNTGTVGWNVISGIPANTTVTSFTVAFGPSSGDYINGFRVDGVPLLDSDTTNMGANAFYLPFDGSAPIGQDQSGRGNNWTPVNFGGSNTIEKATGALPILNTDGGGKVARVGVRTDANASSLVLALPLVGIKSDFSNAVNSGTSNKAITATNATATSSFSNFYGGSFDFSGTASTKTLSFPAGSDLTFGTGDFTIEVWVYMISRTTSYNQYVLDTTGRLAFLQGSSYGYEQITFYDTANNYTTTSAVVQYGKWQHWAVTRQSGTIRIFLDGVSQTLNATSSTTNIGSQTTGYVGCYFDGGGVYNTNGYIQDFRIYKGLAKYTSNFIPASTDPDIVPDSPSGVSYSSNVALVPSTDGSVAFDGSGDYLSLASSTDFDFAGDFTVEVFVNVSAYNGSGNASTIVGKGSNSWIMSLSTSGVLNFGQYGVSLILSGSRYVPTGSWTHIAVSRSGSTIYGFINGVLDVSATSSANFTNSNALWIGSDVSNSSQAFNGTISNVHVVKGTALYTSNFTPPTGPISSVANTKLLCCKSNSSATAFDVSPGTITANGNAAATNFNPFTVNINTQRGKQSGYATLNPLWNGGTLSNGNLTAVFSAGSEKSTQATIGMSSGKYYWEVTKTGGSYGTIGIALQGASTAEFVGRNASSWGYASSDGNKYFNTTTGTSYGPTYTTGDTISVSFDADLGVLTFYKNGISLGAAFTGLTSGPYFPAVGNQGFNCDVNFGQKPFKFPPPAGFQPLTLANTPRPTIVRPDQFVGISTWTGNGGTGLRTISADFKFKADFVWEKVRTGTASHILYDSVRGFGASKALKSNSTVAEGENDNSTYGYVNSTFNGGIEIYGGSSAASDSFTNQTNQSMVAWCWKAGGNSNTYNINDVGYATASAAGLTAGTITPTGASVNTKSGFSIIKVPGTASAASFSHGLGQAPAFVILKETNGTGDWQVGHKSLSSGAWTSRLGLNLTTAEETTSSAWNNTPPTSSLITVGATSNVNNDFIVYAWAEVPGFSKFGSYTGTSSTNFINLGFKPVWVMIKNSSSSSYPTYTGWAIFDAKRTPNNTNINAIFANSSQQEGLRGNGSGSINPADFSIDLLSNGFCLRDNGASEINLSGNTYIYAAWAETPTQNLYGAQSNAR